MRLKVSSRICVSIAETKVDSFARALMRVQSYGMELAEIRMDALVASEQTPEKIGSIFSRPINLIATCRPDRIPDYIRKTLLLAAIECKAAYVDIEVEASEGYRREILDKARSNGCKAIISYHDFDKTPSREELDQIIERCFGNGADIAKISCMSNSARDNARLLGLLDCGKQLIVLGMGENGRLVRVLAPLLGSAFTYASLESGGETAPGQMDMLEVKRRMEELIRAGFHEPR
jgi:3-dehydroquinate dehydratase I